MMNPETWILISIAILASQYAAIKISERGLSRWRQAWTELATDQAQIYEEMPEEAPPESNRINEVEQESMVSQEPAASKDWEEQSQVEEPADMAQRIQEIELITAKINELKELLEMSKELKKELQKLAEALDPAKSHKRVN